MTVPGFLGDRRFDWRQIERGAERGGWGLQKAVRILVRLKQCLDPRA